MSGNAIIAPPPRQQQAFADKHSYPPLTLIFNPTPKSGSSPTQILAARLHQTMVGNWSTSLVDLDDKSQLVFGSINQLKRTPLSRYFAS